MRFAKKVAETPDRKTLRSVDCKARAPMIAQSFEQLVAAICRRDIEVIEREQKRLNAYANAWDGSDSCKPMQVDGDTAKSWAIQLLTSEGLFHRTTEWMGQVSPDGGGFTDIQTDREVSNPFSIEVKAQFTKVGLGEVTQADYLTGYSDFLAHFILDNGSFRSLLKKHFPQHLKKLAPRASIPDGWSLWDLLLAEILGLYDVDHLEAAGIESVDDLHRFARVHYLMHVVGRLPDGQSRRKPPAPGYPGGARLIRFDSFDLVKLLLAGNQPEVAVKKNESAVRVSFGQRGKTQYTIHVGYKLSQLSKSKLHIDFFTNCGGQHIQ